MDESTENVVDFEIADSDGWVIDENGENENSISSSDLDSLQAVADANGEKIDGIFLSLDEIDSKIEKAGSQFNELKTAQESNSIDNDIQNDIATLASYQTLLLLVLTAFVAISVGSKIAGFLFGWMRDK